MAAKATSSVSFPHFAEPTSVTTTLDINPTTGRFINTSLDIRWTDGEGRKKIRTITSISKNDAWDRARKLAQKLANQGLKPTISRSPDRPLMMHMVDLKTGEIEQRTRCYSVDEAVCIAARLAKSLAKLPVFFWAPVV
jgi:hypothetical protein